MTYDVDALRQHFPALRSGWAHFDGPGGSQVPEAVGASVAAALTSGISNRGHSTPSERRAHDIVVEARQAAADLLGADPRAVVFGRSMTQLTYDLSRAMAKQWSPGDEVVVSRLDHDANIRPWIQAAEAVGATVRWIDFDPVTTEVTEEDVAEALSPRTRLVALTGASNLLGTRPAVAPIARLVHEAGGLLYLDAVHLAPHAPIDLADLGADVLVCSPYKLLGPHCGVLAARPELLEALHPDKLLASTEEIPERFELGTLPYEQLAGTTAAIDFLAGIAAGQSVSRRARLRASMAGIEAHEHALCQRLEAALEEIAGVTLHGHARSRTPTLLLTVGGHPPSKVSELLAERAVHAPAGSFYAPEASRWIGLGDDGAVRVGLAPYTTAHEVERLIDAVAGIAQR